MGQYYRWKLGRLEVALKAAIDKALREGVSRRDIKGALLAAVPAESEAQTAICELAKPGDAANENECKLPRL